MAIDFPSSPTEGQVHNVSPGVSFVARSGLWVPAPLKTALLKNYIVNPGMQISQQNGNVANNINGYYPADQWQCVFAGYPTVDSISTPATHPLFLPFNLSLSTTIRVLSAGEYVFFQQSIEGNRVADLQWGTPDAKQIVVHFCSNAAPNGTYCLAIRNAPVVRSYVVNFAVTAASQEYTFVIPGDTGGTWAKDSTAGMHISFCPAAGTTYRTLQPNQWNNSNSLGSSSMTNFTTTGTGTFNIAQVGLYADPYKTGVAPPFAVPDYAQELRRCQRYWYRQYSLRGGAQSSTFLGRAGSTHPAPMRIVPTGAVVGTPSVYDAGVAIPITSLSSSYCNEFAAEFDLTCAAGGMTPGRAAVQYYQGDGNYIAMSARM